MTQRDKKKKRPEEKNALNVSNLDLWHQMVQAQMH